MAHCMQQYNIIHNMTILGRDITNFRLSKRSDFVYVDSLGTTLLSRSARNLQLPVVLNGPRSQRISPIKYYGINCTY